MKKILISFIPPFLISIARRLRKSGWHGRYNTWEDASSKATGYDNHEILYQVHTSLLKVKNGIHAYERDSVLFDDIHYSWPLLTGIMLAAAKSKGVINVLDFGGSLGSTYYQNKKFLDQFKNVVWCIVEQDHFVKIGKKDFEDERLRFYPSVEHCIAQQSINVLILSSVLEYIKTPYELISDIVPIINADVLIIDRTPFVNGGERIVVQTVPPNIYNASYPCHLFNQERLQGAFTSKGYMMLEQFESLEDGTNDNIRFMGFIYIKNDT